MYDPEDELKAETSTEPRSVGIAYLLAACSVFGLAGFHRFYMGKIATGILWTFTFGLFGIGLVYDLVTMRKQIAAINERRGALANDSTEAEALSERLAFALARAHGGWLSPAQLSLDGNMPVDQARAELDSLVVRGYAVSRVRANGSVVYVFPEFENP